MMGYIILYIIKKKKHDRDKDISLKKSRAQLGGVDCGRKSARVVTGYQIINKLSTLLDDRRARLARKGQPPCR
jgi:hypothetical protein